MKGRQIENRGYTLIEILITIAMIAILLTLVIPGYRNFILNNQRASVMTELMNSLQFARSEAVTRGAPLTVCRSNTPSAAAPACLGGAGWETGWLVFLDVNGDGDIDAGEAVVRVRESLPANTTLRGMNQVVFQPAGTTANTGNLTYCDNRGISQGRRINVVAGGQLQLGAAVGSCI